MKIFEWMQTKLNGRQGTNKPNSAPPTQQPAAKEEFSDWPNALLAIGTFGNDPTSPRDHPDQLESTLEDQVVELQLGEPNYMDSPRSPDEEEEEEEDPNDQALEYPHRNHRLGSESGKGEDDCGCGGDHGTSSKEGRTSTVVPVTSGRDVLGHDHYTNNKAINKKSLSFLLKKMFVCSSGIAPSPSSIREHYQVPESRMEKILRAILNKKIYPQSPSSTQSMKKYLQNDQVRYVIGEDDIDDDKADAGSKWVKTDSEYIVLEM